MKKTGFLVLSTITVILVICSLILINHDKQSTSGSTRVSELLYPALAPQINNISALKLKQGKNTTTISKTENHWGIEEKDHFPGDFEKIKKLILSITQIKIIEPKTQKPENYIKLGVQDTKEENATSKSIQLISDGKELASLIVGNDRPSKVAGSPNWLYVRKNGDKQVWLVESDLSFDANPEQWLNSEVFQFEPKKIQSITIFHPNKKPIQLTKTSLDATDFSLTTIPDGKKLKISEASSLASIVKPFRIDDVSKNNVEAFKKDNVVKTKLTTFDGLAITMQIVKNGEEYLSTLHAEYDQSTADAFKTSDTKASQEPSSEQESTGTEENVDKVVEDKQQTRIELMDTDQVQKEIESLNSQFKDWVFTLPYTSGSKLTTKLEELIE